MFRSNTYIQELEVHIQASKKVYLRKRLRLSDYFLFKDSCILQAISCIFGILYTRCRNLFINIQAYLL